MALRTSQRRLKTDEMCLTSTLGGAIHRTAFLGAGAPTCRLIYRSQTAATEFAAAQIAAHNPTDNSVIVVNDSFCSAEPWLAALGWPEDGRRSSVR